LHISTLEKTIRVAKIFNSKREGGREGQKGEETCFLYCCLHGNTLHLPLIESMRFTIMAAYHNTTEKPDRLNRRRKKSFQEGTV